MYIVSIYWRGKYKGQIIDLTLSEAEEIVAKYDDLKSYSVVIWDEETIESFDRN